jgi:hypothetical protein
MVCHFSWSFFTSSLELAFYYILQQKSTAFGGAFEIFFGRGQDSNLRPLGRETKLHSQVIFHKTDNCAIFWSYFPPSHPK